MVGVEVGVSGVLCDQVLPAPRHGELLAVEQQLPVHDGNLTVRLVLREDKTSALVIDLQAFKLVRDRVEIPLLDS